MVLERKLPKKRVSGLLGADHADRSMTLGRQICLGRSGPWNDPLKSIEAPDSRHHSAQSLDPFGCDSRCSGFGLYR